ncbi:putative interstitial collagenase [Helianthus annuus]|nr:putative interstitial collagenase [Helianthus annuus]
MLMPRCGQPDIKSSHNHETKLLHIVSHYQFFNHSPRWPPSKSHLTYAFGLNYPNEYIPPVVRAFNTWTSASGYFTFSRAVNITSSYMIITFERRGVGNGVVFDNDTLAYAYAPTDGRFFYNVDVNWSVTPESNAFDLETAALHEIGHLLGLAHSQDENAIRVRGALLS